MLGPQHKFGTVYHPQSQGRVERMNPVLREEGPRLEYVKQFKAHKALVSSFASQVTADQGQEQMVPEAKWVWLKVYKQKWNEPRWTGPFEVVTRTSHAVQLRGKGETWYHWSPCAVAEEPRRSKRLCKKGDSAKTPKT